MNLYWINMLGRYFYHPDPHVSNNHLSLMWVQLKPFLLTIKTLICLLFEPLTAGIPVEISGKRNTSIL